MHSFYASKPRIITLNPILILTQDLIHKELREAVLLKPKSKILTHIPQLDPPSSDSGRKEGRRCED
jgi:hypothetical protein